MRRPDRLDRARQGRVARRDVVEVRVELGLLVGDGAVLPHPLLEHVFRGRGCGIREHGLEQVHQGDYVRRPPLVPVVLGIGRRRVPADVTAREHRAKEPPGVVERADRHGQDGAPMGAAQAAVVDGREEEPVRPDVVGELVPAECRGGERWGSRNPAAAGEDHGLGATSAPALLGLEVPQLLLVPRERTALALSKVEAHATTEGVGVLRSLVLVACDDCAAPLDPILQEDSEVLQLALPHLAVVHVGLAGETTDNLRKGRVRPRDQGQVSPRRVALRVHQRLPAFPHLGHVPRDEPLAPLSPRRGEIFHVPARGAVRSQETARRARHLGDAQALHRGDVAIDRGQGEVGVRRRFAERARATPLPGLSGDVRLQRDPGRLAVSASTRGTILADEDLDLPRCDGSRPALAVLQHIRVGDEIIPRNAAHDLGPREPEPRGFVGLRTHERAQLGHEVHAGRVPPRLLRVGLRDESVPRDGQETVLVGDVVGPWTLGAAASLACATRGAGHREQGSSTQRAPRPVHGSLRTVTRVIFRRMSESSVNRAST